MMKESKYFKILGAALVISSLGMYGNVSAWGPERETFTMENPATYPTFNSITNNNEMGDERDFVSIAQINPGGTETFSNSVEVIPGQQYRVYIFYHNNASATFNDSAHSHSGVAFGARMSSSFSKYLSPDSPGQVTATITANNTNPESVWDEAQMTTTYNKVVLDYVAGSAKIRNDWKANGSILSTNLFTETGTLIGENDLNGIIPGCEEYSGVVSYVLQAEQLSGTVEKTASVDGENYSDQVDAKPGDTVTFKLHVKNTGDVELTNGVLQDSIPEGLTFVPGSVRFMANNSGTWDTLTDGIATDGYDLGTIGSGNEFDLTYQVTVGDGFDCEGTTLMNSATLTYDSDQKTGDSNTDFASVNVKDDDCTPSNPTSEWTEDTNGEEETCATNPNLPGCSELPDTGPVEVAMVVAILLGIAGGGYYLYRSNKKLGVAKKSALGKNKSYTRGFKKKNGGKK